jgi:hypothetical protein
VPGRPAALHRLAIPAGLLAALAATNRWLSWSAGQTLVTGRDETDYRAMALYAPHLPKVKFPNQHAEAFGPSYVVGSIAHLLSINVDFVFRAGAIVVVVAICLCLHAALNRAEVSTPAYAVCMAVLVLNTYSFRYYLIVPGYIADITFALAIGLALNAVIGRHYLPVLLMLVVATFAHQSAIPMGLPFAWWVAFGPGWREARPRLRWLRALGLAIAPFLAYIAIKAIVAPFSYPATPGIAGITVLGDFEHLGANIGALVEHVARVANPLFAVISLAGFALAAIRRTDRTAKLPFEAIGCAVVGVFIAGQPLLFNTNYSGHPERLTVLSLLSFTIALGYVLRTAERLRLSLSPRIALAIAVVLGIGSLQYLFTVVGPSTALQGAVLQLIAAAVAGVMLWQSYFAGGERRLAGPAPPRAPGQINR